MFVPSPAPYFLQPDFFVPFFAAFFFVPQADFFFVAFFAVAIASPPWLRFSATTYK